MGSSYKKITSIFIQRTKMNKENGDHEMCFKAKKPLQQN